MVGEVDLPSYDFSLSQFFACRRPWNRPEQITAIGRFGAATNYDELYQQLAADGIFLVHSPEQHLLASELPRWYPLLEGLLLSIPTPLHPAFDSMILLHISSFDQKLT